MASNITSKAPAARRSDFERVYKSAKEGSVIVKDPYEYLERYSDETNAFLEDQAAFTEGYLAKSQKLRDSIKEEITANFNYPRFSPPALKADGHYYYSYNTGLQAQTPLYRIKQERIDKDSLGELFFDPNLLSDDGTIALSTSSFSHTGKYWAYALSQSGSDWVKIYVRPTSAPHKPDSAVGKDEGRLEDELQWVKFSGITWMHDDSGFFYGRFPKPSDDGDAGKETDKNVNQKLYFHRLGTSQEEDIVVVESKEKDSPFSYGASITDDGRYLCLYTHKDTGMSLLLAVADLSKQTVSTKMEFVDIIKEWGNYYTIIGNDGPLLYIQTNLNASNYKVVTYDLEHPENGFVDLVPESKAVLDSASLHGQDKLLLICKEDAVDRIYLHDLKSGKRITQIGENIIACVGSLSGKREHDEFWFSISSFLTPGQIFRYKFKNPEGQQLSLYRSTNVSGIKPDDYETEQVFYESKDGTKIPMFIITPKGVARNGTAPCLLYGYGGFSISIPPTFSASWMSFIKGFGGILAVPNIRGGGEYGEAWHQAGCEDRKQNVFDDFQAAAKWIIDNKRAGKVIANGGSNGGLLVAAVCNQAPQLFAAGVCEVGVLDMLRFSTATIGHYWIADYGDPETPEGFDYLYKYSPVHNVPKSGEYPAFYISTSSHDDRVSPFHSFKMAAELQHVHKKNKLPILMRVELKAGHGAGKSTEKRIQEAADKWTFVGESLGLKWKGQ